MPAASKLPVRDTDNPVVRRIQRYINLRWKGNLTHAAAALQVNYDQLWRSTRPTCGRPSLHVIIALANFTNIPAHEWVMGRKR